MADWSSRHSYTEANVKRYAPASGGVYRLIAKSGDKYPVFYVGQGKDLEERLLDHLSSSEPNACIKRHLRDYSCYFRFLKVASAADRARIEKQQIDEFKPSCNK